MTAIFSLIGGTNQFIMSLILKNISYSPIDLSSIINLCVSFFGLPYQNILHSLPLPYYILYWSFIFMDIIWIIFAGLMFCGTSKKKPGLMVPFIGLVGLMNVVRTIITDFTHCKCFPHRKCRESLCRKVFPVISM